MRKPIRMQWLLLALLVLSIGINYIDRSNLSVAATDLSRELSLSKSELGLLLSAFFWTYASFQVLAGWLVQRFNVYLVYGLAFALWSAATALTGFAGGLASLFALRLALGAGESVAYPAYARIIASDFDERHRGFANAAIDAGSKSGPALGTLIGGLVVAHYGWRSLFFVLGFGAMLWLIPWFVFMPSHSRTAAATAAPSGGPGFLEIAARRDFWGKTIGLFCGNYVWYFILTWLPPYLEMERHFSKSMMAVYGSVPYWGIAASSITCGWLSDRLIERGRDPVRVRKGFTAAGLLATTLILPACLVDDPLAAMVLLTVGCLAYGMFSSNSWALTQTLAGPSAAGKWTGMENGIANLAGIIAPWLTGILLDLTGRFLLAFVAVCGVLIIGATSLFWVIGKAAPITWRSAKEPNLS